jgi:O-antigen/teichoic acid export membrane protein
VLSKKLLTSTLAYTIGGGLPMAASLLLLPFYTNAFSPSQFGILSLLIGLTLLYYHFVNVALDSYLSLHYHFEEHNEDRLNKLVSTIFVLQLMLGTVFFLVMMLIGQWVTDAFMSGGEVEYFWSGLTCVVTAITTSTLRIHQNLQIQKKEPTVFFITSLINSALMFGLCVLFLQLLPGSIDGPLLGRMIAGVCMLLYVAYKRFPWAVDFGLIKGWFSFCWPLALMGIAAWSLTYLSPYILNRYVDEHEIGLYSLVLSLMLAVDFFQNGLASAIYPQLFGMRVKAGNEVTSGEKPFHHLYSMLSIFAVGLAMLGLPLLVLLLVKKPEYHEALAWLPLFAIAYVWRGAYSTGFSIALFRKDTRMLMNNSLASMALQIALTLALAASFGLTGALIGTISGRIAQALLLYNRTKSGEKTQANPIKMFLVPGLMTGFLALIYANPWGGGILINGAIGCITSTTICLAIYHKEIPALLAWFKSPKKRGYK